jgi:hypothetical protein
VEAWSAFTWVREIVPFRLIVTFIQFVAPAERRKAFESSELPQAVLAGISERSVGAAVLDLPVDARLVLSSKSRQMADQRTFQEAALLERAGHEFDTILRDELADGAAYISRQTKLRGLQAAFRKLNREAESYGQRFHQAKQSTDGSPTYVGSVGGRGVFMSSLSTQDRARLRLEWTPDWQRAFTPWSLVGTTPVWRAGGALFSVQTSPIAGV